MQAWHMITADNFKGFLAYAGFEELGENHKVWSKSFSSCELKVDFSGQELIYPENKGLIVNERQTCNFKANENFVVFECVWRLLDKGYKPEHIELEPRWKVGHGASGGRADILIKDNSGNSLLIIECKTWGEFGKAWQEMLEDGGQLFSYAQQIKSTQFLCLYASNFTGNNIEYSNYIITLNDNSEHLRTLKEPLSFKEASSVQELYMVWHRTYNCEYETAGIFERACAAYEIGKAKHAVSDLQEIAHEDIQTKYHQFATILRKHNVSGRENAFDKLVNLFLAKIVDEMRNPEGLQFYWRGVTRDSYYDLQDRIQRLYRDGMQKFLGEEVTYIDNSAIEDAFRLFKHDPDATRETILEYFRQLKFYTNNDFAFLDVHNKQLFLQNSEVLLEIIRMLQDIKLKTEEQNQFLGDLFEGFLDQGIKQSEGQFFTPTPIVKFLVSSLPLKTLIEENEEPLNVIDYACGAGHFLNEYAMQIRAFLPAERVKEYYGRIKGIEKEYRLSKVAKVSAFMYEQDDIQIIYSDALIKHPNVKDGSFNVLISNPPYSVKGFLETLNEEDRADFDMIKLVKDSFDKNNNIELFFVERAKQLLSPGGAAAIILPSSLLSNSGALHTKAREIILQYFDIVAIAEFGSGTFGKTGTNTIAAFLRRKRENPSLAEHYRNRVEAWFKGDFLKDGVFEDAALLSAYCSYIGFALEDYKTLLNSTPNRALLATGIFKSYRDTFDMKETRAFEKRANFNKLSKEEKETELNAHFAEYARGIEKDKLYFFMLAYTNPQTVITVKTPPSTDDSKRFLGYEWSGRKGTEGIKYIAAGFSQGTDEADAAVARLKGIKSISTPLFNPADLEDAGKINSAIRANFNGENSINNEHINRIRLVDMLDFSGVKFEKTISLATETFQIANKYPSVILKSLLIDINGAKTKINQGEILQTGAVPVVSQLANKLIEGYTNANSPITDVPLIVFGDHSCTIKYIDFHFVRGADGTQLLKIDDSLAKIKYVYYILKNIKIINKGRYERHFKYLKQLKIPLPPLSVQQEIVNACGSFDEKYERTRMSIEEYLRRIEQIFNDMKMTISGGGGNLNDKHLYTLSIGKRILDSQLTPNGVVPVYSANVFEPFGYINEHLITDFSVSSVIWGIDGDWQVNYIPAGKEFYPTDHCGVLRVLTDKVNPRCLAWALYAAGKKRGFSRTLRASIDRVARLTVQLPTIDEQNKAAEKVFELEALIDSSKLKLAELEAKRKSVLNSYLM
jgi:type I restriction-modification system DNA methylase subunit/restriction endonuclease S subunit